MNILCALALAIALQAGADGKVIDAGCRRMTAASLTELYLRMLPPPLEKAREAVLIALQRHRDFWFVDQRIAPKSPK